MTSPRLGVFTLGTQLGQGGMATVYRGVHTELGTPVAVKVVTASFMRTPALVRALQDEVRAIAGLNHPNIIWVHDAGEVDARAAAASEGGLVEGSPWYAMELLDERTLGERTPDPEALVEVLLELLEALAHAHARRVLHLDLKPENVLFGPRGPVLSDFGMAFSLRAGTRTPGGGTPATMAPEQIARDRALLGPWTDLYALGCVAWRMLSGRDPYGTRPKEAALGHLHRPVPPPEPSVPAPPGLDRWVVRMMAKEPGDRFRSAAEAAWALEHLDAVDPGRPPLPRGWRGPVVDPPPPALLGTGLALYGQRVVPLVGRGPLRDALWQALRSVDAERRPRVVLLRGPAGCGKSALARWLCQRAEEAGGVAFETTHNPGTGPMDGVAGLVADAFALHGVPGKRLAATVAEALARDQAADATWESEALASVLHPERPDGVRLGAARYAVVGRALARRAGDGVGVVWLDDVQWGLDALRFVEELSARPDTPLLFVLTVRDDALAQRPAEQVLLDGLEAEAWEVGPLHEASAERLLHRLLQLAPGVRREVALRCGGNPLFLTQLVGDWVQRGLLVVGRDGFDLPAGTALPLPAPLAAVWAARVREALGGVEGPWRDALEAAAILGRTVDNDEWTRVCARAGLRPEPALLRRLLDHALARRDPGRPGQWSFAHGMLREAIVAESEARGTAPRWHAHAAHVLAGNAVRVAYHLEGCQRPVEAIDAWLEAQRQLLSWDRVVRGRALDRCLELLEAHVAPGDPRWGEARYASIHLAIGRGDHARVEALLAAERARDPDGSEAREHIVRSTMARGEGRWDAALASARAAEAAAETLHDRVEAARARAFAAGVGEAHAEAQAACRRALAGARGEDRADLLAFLCTSLCRSRKLGAARAVVDDLAALASLERTPRAEGLLAASRAAVAWETGDLEGALSAFEVRLRCDRRTHADESITLLNLALLQLSLGRLAAARRSLDRAEPKRRSGVATHAALSAVWAARAGAWERLGRVPGPDDGVLVERTLAILIGDAAARARRAGVDGAAALADLATALHRRLEPGS